MNKPERIQHFEKELDFLRDTESRQRESLNKTRERIAHLRNVISSLTKEVEQQQLKDLASTRKRIAYVNETILTMQDGGKAEHSGGEI